MAEEFHEAGPQPKPEAKPEPPPAPAPPPVVAPVPPNATVRVRVVSARTTFDAGVPGVGPLTAQWSDIPASALGAVDAQAARSRVTIQTGDPA